MKRGLKADLLEEVLNFLVQEKELPVRYRDHQIDQFQAFPRCSGVSYPAGLAFGLQK